MKILHINCRYDSYGGAEQHLHDLCRAQIAAGHQLVVLTSPGMQGNPIGREKVCVIEPSRGVRSGKRVQRKVIQLLKDEAPDIVHLHNTYGFISPIIMMTIQKRKPTVKTVHDLGLVCFHIGKAAVKIYKDKICQFPMGVGCCFRGCFSLLADGPKKMLLSTWEMEITKGLGKVLVGSHYVKNELLRNGFSEERIAVLPLYTSKRAVESPRIESDKKTPVILFVGRLEAVKGITFFIEALHCLRDKQWRAEIVGDGPFLQEARTLAQGLALEERVAFWGSLPPERVEQHYRDACMVVMPSMIPESFGLVGIEAMALRTPVVAFNSGGIMEWLVDHETGFLVKRGNVSLLADRMGRLLEDGSLARQMGRWGQERVERYYREETYLKRLFAIYEEVISNRSKVLATC